MLLNPFLEIKIPKGTSKIDIEISSTDFSWNPYEIIRIPDLNVFSSKDTRMRVTNILNFEGGDFP